MRLKTTLYCMQACGALFFSTTLFAADETQTEVTELQAITVQGRALSYYKEDETTLATKTDTPIDETPQSVQVITNTMIEDQAARQITDLYRSISGISQSNISTVTLRGFSQDEILYDGMRGDPYSGFSIPQLFTIDQVQVLKGPSGALYGAGEPGGVINYVTKKPTFEQENTVTVSAGNKGYLSTSVESSGPLNEDASQRYRVAVMADEDGSYRTNVDQEDQTVDLGYAWDIDDDTTLTLQYTNIYQHIDGARLRGIPTDDDGNFLADTSWNSNSADDYQELSAEVFQASLEHTINSWLSSDFKMRYFENEEVQKYHEVTGISDTDDDGVNDYVKRQYRDQTRTNKALALATDFVAELDKHTILFGADYYHSQNDFLYYRSNKANGLSLTDPVYDDDVSSYGIDYSDPYKDETTVLDRVGVFAQDQWHLTNRLDLTSGVRFDRYEEEYTDHTDDDAVSEYSDTGYSARVGATYKINDSLKPYALVSTGFVPQAAEDQQDSVGGPFDPEESQQEELGLRTYWLDNKLNINFAAYHIIRKNILQEDPDDSDKLISLGKVRSKGFEVDAMMDITSRWVANVSYAYNDVVVKDYNEDDGIQYAYEDHFYNSPYNQLGLWTRYDFPAITSSIAFGADYVSSQINRDGQTVKPYTVYDMSWQTNWDDWKFQLNIKNLLDKEYAVSGFNEKIGSYVGERRRVYLSASYNF